MSARGLSARGVCIRAWNRADPPPRGKKDTCENIPFANLVCGRSWYFMKVAWKNKKSCGRGEEIVLWKDPQIDGKYDTVKRGEILLVLLESAYWQRNFHKTVRSYAPPYSMNKLTRNMPAMNKLTLKEPAINIVSYVVHSETSTRISLLFDVISILPCRLDFQSCSDRTSLHRQTSDGTDTNQSCEETNVFTMGLAQCLNLCQFYGNVINNYR